MSKYLIINTGGTIGMVPTDQGLSPKAGLLPELMSNHAELSAWQVHEIEWLNWQPLLDSSELNPNHWLQLRDQINEHQAACDGILIIHGTDTLAYTAAALSFLIQPFCPIVMTGSMLPALTEGNDALLNLQLSLSALQSERREVMVAVQQLLPASNISKVSTAKFDAFASPNWQQAHWQEPPAARTFALETAPTEEQIGVFTLFPGCGFSHLHRLIDSGVRAIVIQALGNGNSPSSAAFKTCLQKAQNADVAIFVRSQCADGQVSFGQYASSSTFAEFAAIGCGNMSFEAVITKLMLACECCETTEKIKTEFLTPYAREWQTSA